MTAWEAFVALGLAWLLFSIVFGLLVGRLLRDDNDGWREMPWCDRCEGYHFPSARHR